MSIRVLDPTVGTQTATVSASAGLLSLTGRTVGLLDNSKINVCELLDHVEEILRSRHGVKTVVRFKKPDASRPAPSQVVAAMKDCDVVISAVGD